MMNRDLLRKYAEAGVVERLREMQRELEVLAREFPDLVRDADGALPSLIPIRKKRALRAAATPHKPRKARAPQKPREERREDIRAFLSTHPGATIAEIADAIGLGPHTDFRKLLKSVATSKKGAGTRQPHRWTLKGQAKAHGAAASSNGTGKASRPPSKLRKRRELSAAFLAHFDTEKPTTPPPGPLNRGLGSFVRRGYLRAKEDGYVRTAKPFSIDPR